MRKYIGTLEDFVAHPEREYDETFWADYQVLGPMFSALRVFMTMEDVLTVIVGAKGCAYHLNFTLVAWGEIDFDLGKRPLPVLEFSQQQIVMGDFTPRPEWLARLARLAGEQGARRIVLLPTDAMEICGADMAAIARIIAEATHVETTELHVSGISGPNQWAGYDAALEALYRPPCCKSRARRNRRSTSWAGCGPRGGATTRLAAAWPCSRSWASPSTRWFPAAARSRTSKRASTPRSTPWSAPR